MSTTHRARDSALIDALEAIAPIEIAGHAWRVVRRGRDVLTPSAVGGRWDDTTFDVLYTSQTADGAVAEVHFHLARGQPVIPSKVTYELYRLKVGLAKALELPDLDSIARLGVDVGRYGALSYNDRSQEYPRTQEIAETAHFIGFDGLIAPSARWPCMNIIGFASRMRPGSIEVAKDAGEIDWASWLKTPFGY
jgi:RES domain-containing protein